MPFLKMKSNSATSCFREKSCLCVCSKSATISKNTCSRVKILREADIDSCVQSNSVSVCNKMNAQRTEDDKDVDIHHPTDSDDDIQAVNNLSCLTDPSMLTDPSTFTDPSTVTDPSTLTDPSMLNDPSMLTDPATLTDPSALTDPSTLNDPSVLRKESTENSSESTLFSPNETGIEADVYVDAGLQFDGNLIYDNIPDTTCFPDFKCDESSTLFDTAEDYMMLPFLEDTYETACDHEGQMLENASNIDSDDSSLYFAIHQLQYCDQDFGVNTYAEPDTSECFDPHIFIKNQPDLTDGGLNSQLAVSQKDMQKKKSVTLVLDLDETLVHSTLECCDNASFSFSVFFNMKENMVYVKQRPYLQMFLERVAEMFDVVIFTASQSIYAEQLLDKLDPDGKIFSRRAYRESCTCLDGNYIKDLTIFGVDLAKIAIIDNSPQVFQLQVNNGIPIKSWFDDPTDHALISLLPFLETLANADDVRPLIAKKFGNNE